MTDPRNGRARCPKCDTWYDIDEGHTCSVAQVPLSRGLVALVDIEDFERVMAAGSWWVRTTKRHRTAYAIRSIQVQRKKRTIQLHTFLTGWPLVDHINGDGLDNRQANLRPATRSQNNRNSLRPRNNRTGFKGVSLRADSNRWRARIVVDSRIVNLGSFVTPEEAARAYDTAARELHGEFACLNFPAPGERGAA